MNDESMRLTLGVTKALADIQRVRILMLLRSGELCVCQIIEVLGLAPSTVSKHLSILTQAGLVDFRKDGRWAYFRLPDPANSLSSQPVYDWLAKSLHDDRQIQSDWKKLSDVTACDPASVSRRQREGGGALGDRALPELREKKARTVRGGALGDRALPELREKKARTVRGGALGDRALPELREKKARAGRAGSPSTPRDISSEGHAQAGRAGSPSTPHVPLDPPESCVGHSLPQRLKLPHDIPGWIQGSARFFITINCKQQGINTLCHEHVAQTLLASVKQYEASGRWYFWLALLMPDHLHLIVSVSPDLGLRSVIGNWKRFQSRRLGIEWQANFFDHRLRDEEEFRDKAAYIRMNPVRKELTANPEAWPFVLDRTNGGADGGGALGDRALPELREKNARTVRGGALGDRALPELREKNAPSGRVGSPSTPRGGGDTDNVLCKKSKRHPYER